MATNTTSTYSNKVRTMYDKITETVYEPARAFGQFVEDKAADTSMEPGGSVDFYINDLLSPSTSDLSETTDPDSLDLSDSKVNVVLKEKGALVTTTAKLDLTTFNNTGIEVATLVGKHAAESTDLYIRQALDTQVGSDYIKFAGSNTAKSGIESSDDMTGELFRLSSSKLRGKNVAPKIGNDYVAVIHPNVAHDLRADTATGGFLELGRYASPDSIFLNNEVGKYASFRVVESTNARVEYYAGTPKQADTAVTGANAIGATVIAVDSATGIAIDDIISFEIGGNWYSHKVTNVAGLNVTIGKCFNINGDVYRAKSAGLVVATSGGETVREAHPVYTSYFLGYQALAYAYAKKPTMNTIVRQSGMGRLTDVSWHAVHGVAEFRADSCFKVFSGSTLDL